MPTNITPNAPEDSQLVLHNASELTVLPHIQRIPTDARLRTVARNWDSNKEGILFVAKITDGEHAGTLHVYDGGTRWKAMHDFALDDDGVAVGDTGYVFVCWVRDMTEREAAEAFIAFNTESKKPSPYFQYQVGLVAGTDWATAIQCATERKGVLVGQSASVNRLAAVSSAKAIVEQAHRYAATNLPDEDAWEWSCDWLERVLTVTKTAYDNGGAHDSNVLRAVSEILMVNERHGKTVDTGRLAQRVGAKSPEQWHSEGLSLSRVASAGSSHRGTLIRYQMVKDYNLRLGEARRILGGLVMAEEVAA